MMLTRLSLAAIVVGLSGTMAYALETVAPLSDPQAMTWFELGKLGALFLVLGVATWVLWKAYREAHAQMVVVIGKQAELLAEVRDAMRNLNEVIRKCDRKER